jgi:hypothetical protein
VVGPSCHLSEYLHRRKNLIGGSWDWFLCHSGCWQLCLGRPLQLPFLCVGIDCLDCALINDKKCAHASVTLG